MQLASIPFNIELLLLKDEDVKNILPVKVLDIFDGFSRNFHKDGLFSSEIFGKVGEEKRNRMFSYVNLFIPILHPVIYDVLCELKSLYGEILMGKTYAIYNKEINDFEKSDIVSGGTGYSFFMSHLKTLQPEDRAGGKREFNLKILNKYRKDATFDKLVVMPAGLRDYEIDDNGKPSEDEINGMYRKVISIASMIESVNIRDNEEYLDSARYNLQIAVNNIYEYIKSMLEGKRSFILDKWASRKIFHSTRNVITSYVHSSTSLDDPTNISVNDSVVGLYQYLRSTLPLAIKHVRDGFLSNVFVGPNSPAILVNPKTLKPEPVSVDPEYFDSWMTNEGLEKVMAKFGQENLRHEKLEIKGYYLGLIYKGPDLTYRLFQDIDDLPENLSRDHVSPITFTELLYLSTFKDSHKTPCLITRYPITGYGSIYPSYCYVKSTVNSEVRKELDQNWEPNGVIAKEFPINGEGFFNSLSPSASHLKRLTADFDGDMNSFTTLLTEDAKAEIDKLLNSRSYYVAVDGNMAFSADTDIISLVLKFMTGD